MHALGSDTCMDGPIQFYKLVLSSLILKYFKLYARFYKSNNYFSKMTLFYLIQKLIYHFKLIKYLINKHIIHFYYII